MEVYRKKYQLPMLYLIGFGTGILYANFIAKNYVTMTGIFHEYFLNQYTQVKIINEDYLWYLLRWRVMPLALAVCVANLGFRRLTAAGILLWTGFAAGILSVAAVLRMGLCGMLLCIAGIFPQYIFYVPAYLLLIRYYYRYPQSEWGDLNGYITDIIREYFFYSDPVYLDRFRLCIYGWDGVVKAICGENTVEHCFICGLWVYSLVDHTDVFGTSCVECGERKSGEKYQIGVRPRVEVSKFCTPLSNNWTVCFGK